MNTTKMSLANIQGKLTRAEMKNIMAGSGYVCACNNSSMSTVVCNPRGFGGYASCTLYTASLCPGYSVTCYGN